jgi:hypothetical protein
VRSSQPISSYSKETRYGRVVLIRLEKTVPTKTVVFSRNKALMDKPNARNEILWDSLVPIGHGFVNISNPEAYGLLPGIPTDSGVDRYSVAMYHQLHCLVSSATPSTNSTAKP